MNTFSIKNKNFLVLTLVLTFFWLPGFAQAYFVDGAEVINNTFNIGTLDVEVDEESQSVGVSDSSNESFDFDVSNTGSVSAQYMLSATPTACTADFFSGINVEVDQGGTLYTGSLSGLSASTTNEGLWDIEVINDSIDASNGETCEVELLLQSWQEEFTNWNTGGFSEEVTIELTITANEDMGTYVVPDVVLNEIMPNPIGDDHQDGLDGEWVELYNNTGQTIDLDGWYVEDLAGTQIEIGGTSDSLDTTENGTTTIDAAGWLVVYMNDSVLNNSGTETVYLYDGSDVLQDEYTYTAGNDTGEDPEDGATPDNENGDATAGTSASATEGKTDARIPDGVGEWVDPDPTAGGPNYVTREELEELGYSESKIDFLLNRQEVARQNREAREADPVKTEVNGASDPVETEVNGADPVKSDGLEESSDNGAGEKDEDKKEEEIDESSRNEDEETDENRENEETNDDEEKQKVNEDENSDKSEQENDEEEFGDDDKKEKDEDEEQDDDKKVDEDKSDNRKKEEDSDKSLSNERDDSGDTDNDEKESEEQENEDETKDSQEKSDNNDEDADVEDKDKEDKQNSDKEDIDEQQAKDEPVKSNDLEKSLDNEAGDNTN